MKKNFLIVLCFLSVAFFAGAQKKYELTVKEAVDLAFQNVADLKNAQLDYKIQEAKNKEIEGSAFPQLSGGVQGNYYIQTPKFLFPQSDEQIYNVLKRENLLPSSSQAPPASYYKFSFQQPWNMNFGATLTQLLFEPDVFVGLQARKTALNYSQSLIDQVKESIKDSAYKRYYAILVADKILFYIDEGITRLQKQYHDDSIMFKNGFAEKLDLDKVEVQLNNLVTNRNSVAALVNINYARLKFALGLTQQDTVVLKEDLSSAGLKENLLEDNFTYDSRAEIRTLQNMKELGYLDVKRYKMRAAPTVSALGNYTVTAMGQKFFTNPADTWVNSAYVGLNISVPIFDGMQRRRQVDQAKLSVDKVENTLSLAKQGIDLEQYASKEGLKAALQNLDISERNMQLAEKVYAATKTKFEQGVGSSFETLQADSDLQQSQSNYFNALYNAIVARIDYLHSIGKL
jgi:outer membrane protein